MQKTKFTILLCTLFASIAYAQYIQPKNNTMDETLYPYRDISGKFGYVDENMQIRIEPQYKMVSHFTEHGFAVVTDSLNRKGVINKNNNAVLNNEYEYVRLSSLEDYNLAEVHTSYTTRWRFWQWEFLPGFSIIGRSSDSRLFDTQVQRIKKTVYVLGDKPRKVRSERQTLGYFNRYFDIRTLDSNQVLIDDRLYDIRANRARLVASGIKGTLSKQTFAQQKDGPLYIIDRKGKQVSKKPYRLVDSIPFEVAEGEMTVSLSERSDQAIASAYQSSEGQLFIYPDFSKPLPRVIHQNKHPGDPTTEELIRGVWLLASVPNSDYFLFNSFRKGERFFRFLDTQGNWHQTLPDPNDFTVVLPSGQIVWPARKHYIESHHIPADWEMDGITALKDPSLYHIRLRQGKTIRQGVWDFTKQEWLIQADYYEVYSMHNTRRWRYHSEYGGLWGILDEDGSVLIKPTYSNIHPDGLVTKEENGETISFYLHPETLQELRDK